MSNLSSAIANTSKKIINKINMKYVNNVHREQNSGHDLNHKDAKRTPNKVAKQMRLQWSAVDR